MCVWGGVGVACKQILNCLEKCTIFFLAGWGKVAKLGWDIQIYWEGNPGIAAREWILGHLENLNLKKK